MTFTANTDVVIFVHLVGMGATDKDIERITRGGQEWQRQPDESEKALEDCAKSEAVLNPLGTLMFSCY